MAHGLDRDSPHRWMADRPSPETGFVPSPGRIPPGGHGMAAPRLSFGRPPGRHCRQSAALPGNPQPCNWNCPRNPTTTSRSAEKNKNGRKKRMPSAKSASSAAAFTPKRGRIPTSKVSRLLSRAPKRPDAIGDRRFTIPLAPIPLSPSLRFGRNPLFHFDFRPETLVVAENARQSDHLAGTIEPHRHVALLRRPVDS